VLLDNQASVDDQFRAIDGSSLLHAAVESGNYGILNVLLSAGAGKLINIKNTSGWTPFHLAVTSGDVKILEMLHSSLKCSTTFDEQDIDGRTPLHLAVEKQDIGITRWLLDKGAKADIQDFGDTTPFQQAFQQETLEILCLLFPKRAEKDLNLINASKWRSISGVGTDKTILMTNSESKTVNIMSKGELDQYINNRSYSLTLSTLELPVKENSMAINIPENRIL
jgi:ankyrin repeat protein